MKNYFLRLSFLVVFASCVHAQKRMLVFDFRNIDIGTIKKRDSAVFHIRVNNHHPDSSVFITGITESCNCVTNDILMPVHVRPQSSRQFTFKYYGKEDTGRFTQSIFFHTDTDSLFQKVVVSGVVQ